MPENRSSPVPQRDVPVVGAVVAFVLGLAVALTALSLAFDSVLIAIAPAIAIAACAAFAVVLTTRKR
jgi:hypothetical protein